MRKIFIVLVMTLVSVFTACTNDLVVSQSDVVYESVTIMEDTDFETTAFYYNKDGDGKRLGIIGGIHGNETAGFKAANLMMDDIARQYKDASILFIPNANMVSIREDKRFGEGHTDLNRSFDVEEARTETEELALEIKKMFVDFEVEFLIDHHESYNNYLNTDGKYKLGNTVIVTDYGDNVLDNLFIVENINPRIKDDIPFKLETNPPKGSFNRTMTETLGIYVATIETNRKLDLDKRIEEQVIVAEEIIKYFMESSE